MAHLPQEELTRRLGTAAKQVEVGGHYIHYKDFTQTYLVTGLAIAEANDSIVVVYQAEYGEQITFVRPLTSWLDHVEHGGKRVARFTLTAS